MRLFLLLLLSFFLLTCSNQETRRQNILIPPDSLISREKLVLILADIHMIDAAITAANKRRNDTTGMSQAYYQVIFDKYRITRNSLQKNLDFYKQDPEDFSMIYDEVVKYLESLEISKGESEE